MESFDDASADSLSHSLSAGNLPGTINLPSGDPELTRTDTSIVYIQVFIVRRDWRSSLLSAAGCRPLTTALSRDRKVRNSSVQRRSYPAASVGKKDFYHIR